MNEHSGNSGQLQQPGAAAGLNEPFGDSEQFAQSDAPSCADSPCPAMSGDDFDILVESEASEYGEMLEDGGPSNGWSFSCEALVDFSRAIINAWGMECRAHKTALAARHPVGAQIVGYMDPEADFMLPRAGDCMLMSKVEVCLWRAPHGKWTKQLYDAPPAPAAVPVDAKLIWWLSDAIGILSASGNTFHAEELQKLHDMLATHPQPAAAVPSTGVQAIAEERARQVQVEGMTPEGDAGYRHGQLAWAAVAYMQLASMELRDGGRAHIATASPPACWPWDASWWKPRDVRRDLVRAGALIAAQVDALDSQGKANG